jgi:hypothetical protein
MSYVICSEEGFWLTDFGWSLGIEESDVFDETEKDFYLNSPHLLPGAKDVRLIEITKIEEYSCEMLCEAIAKALVLGDNKAFEAFSDKYLHTGITYKSDGVFSNLEEDFDNIGAIMCVADDLMDTDNDILCQITLEQLEVTTCYCLDDEFFYTIKS